MSAISSEPKEGAAGPAEPPQDFFDARAEFASRFLAGEGLEIGALHLPLAMPPQARPKYVDRMSADQLRSEYPELGGWTLTDPDLIDNGELLETGRRTSLSPTTSSSTARIRSGRSAPTSGSCAPAVSSSTLFPTSAIPSTTAAR